MLPHVKEAKEGGDPHGAAPQAGSRTDLRCPHGGHGLHTGSSAQPGSGPTSKYWASSATTSRYFRIPNTAFPTPFVTASLRIARRGPTVRISDCLSASTTVCTPSGSSDCSSSTRPTWEPALRNFIRYLSLHVQGATVNLAVEGNTATLTWHVDDPGMEAIDHIGDAALATLYNIMHELCGRDWRPSEVWLRTSPAARRRTLPEVFPRSASLRRRDLRAAFSAGTPEAPLARHRRRNAQSARKGDRIARATLPRRLSRRRCAASCARRSCPVSPRPTTSPRCSACTAAR